MKVKIVTMVGDIVVCLYDETTIHRDNFVKLLKSADNFQRSNFAAI